MWNLNPLYIGEHNTLLENISHTFDSKIVAYYGYIGTDDDITTLGTMGSIPLASALGERRSSNDLDGALKVLGVMQQRIWDGNFDVNTPVTSVDNDGMVPKSSAAFDGETIEGQVECPSHDHLQMLGNSDVVSTPSGVVYSLCNTDHTLRRSLCDTLAISPPDDKP
jgi:hypothetical protein